VHFRCRKSVLEWDCVSVCKGGADAPPALLLLLLLLLMMMMMLAMMQMVIVVQLPPSRIAIMQQRRYPRSSDAGQRFALCRRRRKLQQATMTSCLGQPFQKAMERRQ
jgi:hypothetical protein